MARDTSNSEEAAVAVAPGGMGDGVGQQLGAVGKIEEMQLFGPKESCKHQNLGTKTHLSSYDLGSCYCCAILGGCEIVWKLVAFGGSDFH